MERYRIFAPVDELRRPLSHGFVQEHEDHVAVVLFVDRSDAKVEIHFTSVAAYRRVMEECALSPFSGVWEDPLAPMPSFIVEDSEWLAQFSDTELIHHQNLTHYVFLTGWQQIEVLSSDVPSVVI